MRAEERGRPRAILIAGPTASGKSALALGLAERLGGRIINADSMQVYRDLSILTARPTEAETARAPHALYGTIDGATAYSVSLWLADVRRELARARADQLVPIFVGGTGLYFKALTQGLSDIPAVPADTRAKVRAWAEGQAPEALHAELARRDPATAARLRPTDPQRILRALEVHEATGQSLAGFHAERASALVDPADTLAIALTVERANLRARIDARFDAMIVAGAIGEVERLAARDLDSTLPVMRAIGVPPLLRHVAGEITLEEAVRDAKNASGQYIKRQETFIRHQLHEFRPVASEGADTIVLSALQSFV